MSRLRVQWSGYELVKVNAMSGAGYTTPGFSPDAAAHTAGDVLSPIVRFAGLGVEDCAGVQILNGVIHEIHITETCASGSLIKGDHVLYITTQSSLIQGTNFPNMNAAFSTATPGAISMESIIDIIDVSSYPWIDIDANNAMKIIYPKADHHIPIHYAGSGDHIYAWLVTNSADDYADEAVIGITLLSSLY